MGCNRCTSKYGYRSRKINLCCTKFGGKTSATAKNERKNVRFQKIRKENVVRLGLSCKTWVGKSLTVKIIIWKNQFQNQFEIEPVDAGWTDDVIPRGRGLSCADCARSSRCWWLLVELFLSRRHGGGGVTRHDIQNRVIIASKSILGKIQFGFSICLWLSFTAHLQAKLLKQIRFLALNRFLGSRKSDEATSNKSSCCLIP